MFRVSFLVLFFLLFISTQLVESSLVYTPTTETNCNSNICTKTLYTGIRNVYEDNQWKRVENARSLKGSGIDCIVNSDNVNLVECLDWNITSIELKLSQSSPKASITNVPIKIYRSNNSGDLNLLSEVSESFSLSSNAKTKVVDEFRYGDVIHFGEKSTTIKLVDNETENLGDTMVDENAPTIDFATQDSYILINFHATQQREGIYKWNLTAIPTSANIIGANFSLYMYDSNLDSGESINITTYLIYSNFTVDGYSNWSVGNANGPATDVGEINWNKRPIDKDYYNTKHPNTLNFSFNTPSVGWHQWDVTSLIDYSITNNYNESNFYLTPTLISGTPATNDYIFFRPEDYSDASLRPYLSITYEIIPQFLTCSFYGETHLQLYANNHLTFY